MKNFFFRNNKFIQLIGLDFFASYFSIYFSYLLRFNLLLPSEFSDDIAYIGFFVSLLMITQLYLFRFYELIINYFGMRDLKFSLRCIFVSFFSSFLILFILNNNYLVIPKSVPILYLIIFSSSVIVIRITQRFFYEKKLKLISEKKELALVIGAGDSAAGFLKNYKINKWDIIGILDDDPIKQGMSLNGFKILGDTNKINFFVKKYNIKNVIFAIPSMGFTEQKKFFKKCSENSLNIFIVNAFNDKQLSNPGQIRKIRIEELLGRKEINFDKKTPSKFFNSTVLITGAGGSIGSELVYQIITLNPRKIICVDISEYNLYILEEKIREIRIQKTELVYLICDIKDEFMISRILDFHKPQFIYHAAAYKHVNILENNIYQAFTNNIIGSYNLVTLAQKFKVNKFIFISTDKAVEPINIMGATKRITEKIILYFAKDPQNNTIFSIVRFGNVLESSGSVIPKFKSQIERGGPLSVTHPNVSRFFMSIPEASKLVIEASFLSSGSEIFMLDMGEPVKIKDLAHNMIKISGLTLRDIKIKYVGLRPGEKLKEKLYSNFENLVDSTNPRIMIVKSKSINKDFINRLNLAINSLDKLQESSLKKLIYKLSLN